MPLPARKPAPMPKKPKARTEFVLFDVVYEDGSLRSNRKVSGSLLGGLDKDVPATAEIERQDREIADKAGVPPPRIKTVKRSRVK